MAAVSAATQRLEHLAGTVGPDVLAYLARRVSPVEDAADLYSQVLTITWQKLRAVPADDREAFAWMLGVARRCLANHRRGLMRRSALADRLRDEVRAAVTEPDEGARVDAERTLATLSDADRELVTLVYWEGLSCAEAAQVLGVSGAAARKRLERARATLRSRVGDGAPGPQARPSLSSTQA
jgi:RNA polymerase sigma-70 factor (ECF subfamily)